MAPIKASLVQFETPVVYPNVGLDLSCRDLIPSDNDLKIDLVRGKLNLFLDVASPNG